MPSPKSPTTQPILSSRGTLPMPNRPPRPDVSPLAFSVAPPPLISAATQGNVFVPIDAYADALNRVRSGVLRKPRP